MADGREGIEPVVLDALGIDVGCTVAHGVVGGYVVRVDDEAEALGARRHELVEIAAKLLAGEEAQ